MPEKFREHITDAYLDVKSQTVNDGFKSIFDLEMDCLYNSLAYLKEYDSLCSYKFLQLENIL